MLARSGIAWVDGLVYLIGSLGFPIAVTVWLLYERMVYTRATVEAIQALTTAIQRLSNQLDAYGAYAALPPLSRHV